jgi:hypothetical protein
MSLKTNLHRCAAIAAKDSRARRPRRVSFRVITPVVDAVLALGYDFENARCRENEWRKRDLVSREMLNEFADFWPRFRLQSKVLDGHATRDALQAT